ncbi:iron-sulfur cluster biosynthesis family protein [Jeotgalibacillus haloalkalitolerans]|uniref:Iron-sulfur cluster biosynthesis family protein n=1 Tax=Jeotgalibacillus haloalkalitolerans TaxID=3104292 RepID=A0ABU5KLX1_9BACL|nr:iron-sulfur cluster biosynthesis family protein [Jeotgalibacillus sp. HH7-29]MDZ5712078.1 iron-sulfur cluster biosynthesis family protein [Jeotgalibacillus sp. HH7-29]
MKIEITKTAAEKIAEKIPAESGYLKLKYDTEGTGCVLNGVPILWYVEKAEEEDQLIETNDRPILVETSKKVFYDKVLKIDYSESARTFQLKSPGQMINGRMSFKNTIKN